LKSLNYKGIFVGALISIIISIVLIIALTLWVCYGNLKESTILGILQGISGISVGIGAFFLARNITSGGLINGLFLSVLYLIILYISSLFIGESSFFSSDNLFRIVIILASGMLGGVLGINTAE